MSYVLRLSLVRISILLQPLMLSTSANSTMTRNEDSKITIPTIKAMLANYLFVILNSIIWRRRPYLHDSLMFRVWGQICSSGISGGNCDNIFLFKFEIACVFPWRTVAGSGLINRGDSFNINIFPPRYRESNSNDNTASWSSYIKSGRFLYF